MLPLFPNIKPYTIHQLAVDEIHTLHVEESGNPRGLPVLFIHGGPGAGCNEDSRRFFDPNRYRIILFDQRGAGLSTPHAELTKNSTHELVSDMERIRTHLNIERWVLFGGSWGSTLALVYAEAHPSRVINMILRGIFLCRSHDIDWFYQPGGASRLFPDAWDKFIHHLPQQERKQVVKNFYKHLTGPDEVGCMSAAKAWAEWEGVCSTLHPNPHVLNFFTHPHTALSLARIETHYFINNLFLEPDHILKNVHKLADIPGTIIHGRYDVVCPLDNAYELNKAWPTSTLEIIRDAGHSALEAGITHALISATNRVAMAHA